MNKLIPHLSFKPATVNERTLIHNWLQQDYVHKWIHGEGLQNTLRGLETFLQHHALNKELDRNSEITQHWIGYDGEKPFVYLLTSNVFKNDIYAKCAESEGWVITLDVFICDTNYLGKGLATTVIKEFLLSKFSEAREVFIDPEMSNEKAVHVYQKVGFHIVGEFIAPWHPVLHYIMKLKMKDIL